MTALKKSEKWLKLWTNSTDTIKIFKLNKKKLDQWLKKFPQFKDWVINNDFSAKAGQNLMIYNTSGLIECVLFGIDQKNPMSICNLATILPEGNYQIVDLTFEEAMGWVLHQYKFDTYKETSSTSTKLYFDPSLDQHRCRAIVSSIVWGRDLINLPAQDLTPHNLSLEAKNLAKNYDANINIISDQKEIKNYFPAVYAVGKAAKAEPRIIDFTWGDNKNPAITLIGKGVCFDSGGLNLKPTAGMATMKKDMGGAAHVLALAKIIMELKLPIYLRVIIPAVENSIAGNAYRPGDIITTRNQTTVEITNTDAEGRMILADALTLAQEQQPDIIIDIATLTGAARVALGTDLPGFFSNNKKISDTLLSCCENDPIWQLPLYKPYKYLMESPIADLKNAASSGYGGAITAALFLEHFIENDTPWVHFDLMAANVKSTAGKPEGGEIMGMQAVLTMIEKLYT
jgi:leucyl aminopeptidase